MSEGSISVGSAGEQFGGNPVVAAQMFTVEPLETTPATEPIIFPCDICPISDPSSGFELNSVFDSNLDSEVKSNHSTQAQILHADLDLRPDSWRTEVARRLERYRTRRKPPARRYPSLFLPFDSETSRTRSLLRDLPEELQSSAIEISQCEPISKREKHDDYTLSDAIGQQSAKVIEFPCSAAIPALNRGELADPIFDRPRIVEAPEIFPSPPALGGMLIEPAHREIIDLRTDFPEGTASFARRSLAALADGVLLASALTAITAIFIQVNPLSIPLSRMVGVLSVIAVLLWMAYRFLFLVYTGSTPGMRAVGLRLTRFDGSNVNRKTRRFRVLASFLSALSAGMGYFWCLLDPDGLCWHDRITHTHLQLK